MILDDFKKKYSVKIIFRVKKSIMHLFSKSDFILVSEDDFLPDHDYHKYLMSLPQVFYKNTKKFAKQVNYIPENEKVFLIWKNKLDKIKGFKIGICWQGRKTHPSDHLRSIPLNYFEKLFDIEGVQFISLQQGFGTEQINNFKYKDRLYDFSNENLDSAGNNIFEREFFSLDGFFFASPARSERCKNFLNQKRVGERKTLFCESREIN